MSIDRRNLIAGAAAAAALAVAPQARAEDKLLYLDTVYGRTVIKMRPDIAPKHVAQIETLAKQHFYDNVVFHRVIDGFMAQTGDPTGTGTGKSKLPNIPAEFSKEKFLRGTVGMARGPDENSANSQFFICFAPARYLEEQYTVWGEVVSGMEFIDKIKRGEPPSNPDKIIRLRVAGDES
ncbi:MAG TPA: peptidylprolyl isomerase [Methylocystis sp.]|nr:peptidylprolyl isomerase [Methylocystis sp.]